MSTLLALRQALGTAVDELAGLAGTPGFAAKDKDIVALEKKIADLEVHEKRQAGLARRAPGQESADLSDINPDQRTLSQIRSMDPRKKLGAYDNYVALARKGLDFTPSRGGHFRSLGEQLQSIMTHAMSRGASHDPRLVRAPTGGSEVDPTGGGFLVQIDFATAIFMLAHDMGEILSRVNKVTISANSNGIKIPGVDETSRVNGSRWGGVSTSWVGEGVTVTPSRPKFRMVEFDLKKMMSLAYMTDELLQDASVLTGIYSQAFSEEIVFTTESAIYAGTGAGMPLGVLASGALVSVAKETAQAAGTIVKENIDKQWSRCWSRSMQNAAWFINQDALPQLQALNGTVGVGGQLVYMPPGGISAAPYSTLYGKEVIWTEYSPTVGTVGDILLADWSQYTLVDKNGVQAATSMHVAFLTDEMVFRITYRVDGKPMWTQPLTPAQGTATKSPFIALATRA